MDDNKAPAVPPVNLPQVPSVGLPPVAIPKPPTPPVMSSNQGTVRPTTIASSSPVVKPSTPAGSFSSPITQKPIPQIPIIPGSQSSVSAMPAIPKPQINSSSNDISFRSSIRTMQDDLLAIKKGQLPSGSQLEKTRETTPLSSPIVQPSATIPAVAPRPAIHVELGRAETSKALPRQEALKPFPNPPPVPPPQVKLPPSIATGGISVPIMTTGRKNVYFVILGVIIVLSTGGYLGYSRFIAIEATPSIVVTETPKPVPPSVVENALGINLPAINPRMNNEDESLSELQSIQAFLSGESVNLGETTFYKIIDPDKNQYQFNYFSSLLSFSLPSELADITRDRNLFFSLFGISGDGRKSIGLIIPLVDAAAAKNAMMTWEQSLPVDFSDFFNLNTEKRTSESFLDNAYGNTAIRYMNFPDHNSTIDYGIVNLADGSSVLIITSSKMHIYSIIDALSSRLPSPTQ